MSDAGTNPAPARRRRVAFWVAAALALLAAYSAVHIAWTDPMPLGGRYSYVSLAAFSCFAVAVWVLRGQWSDEPIGDKLTRLFSIISLTLLGALLGLALSSIAGTVLVPPEHDHSGKVVHSPTRTAVEIVSFLIGVIGPPVTYQYLMRRRDP